MRNIFIKIIPLFILSSIKIFSQDPSTWNTIQEKILDVNCTACHYYGSSYAEQSGLILTAGTSHSQLVDVLPKNPAALNDGLERVGSEGGLLALYHSYLWEKINAPNQEHFYQEHPEYGSLMPLGAPPLTNGELLFIMYWILAGAPENGVVADENLLNDTTRFVPVEFQPLDPPQNGIQLHVGPFDVPPQQIYDREFFYFKALNEPDDIFVNSVEITMRPGSHHFILYTFADNIPGALMPQPEIIRDVRDVNGNYDLTVISQMFYHRFFAGTQTPYLNYKFPTGVALRLPAGTGIDMNSHYVNRSNQTIQGEVYTNLHTIEESEVVREAEILFLSNMDFDLPPNDTTTIIKEFTINSKRNFFQLWSHSHEHTLEFKVEKVDASNNAELIYYSNDWQHPPILRLDPPLVVNAGEKIRLITKYYNWTDQPIGFGLLSTEEMQILLGMYYLGEPVTSIENDDEIPNEFFLEQNFPNPFNPITSILYTIPSSHLYERGDRGEFVSLKVYDVLGNEIAVLVNEEKPAGNYSVSFDASALTSGIYFYRLSATPIIGQAGNFTATKKMILLK